MLNISDLELSQTNTIAIYVCIAFTLAYYLQVEKTNSIERQIQSQIVDIIRIQCATFYNFTTDYLRKGLFLCHIKPTMTTYRSTLVNPLPTTTAAELVGIIQSWVSTSPSLIIDGLLVRLTAGCPTCIDNLDAEECDCPGNIDPGTAEMMSQVLSVCAIRQIGQEICTI